MKSSYEKYDRAFIFYFIMSILLLDFGSQIRVLSANPYLANYSNPVFSITRTINKGSAWGIFQNQETFLIIFSIVVLLFLTYYIYKKVSFDKKFELLGLTLFASGALGNLIERIKFGYVIDYIKLNFIDFPIFNAFDIMICLGVGLYCIYTIFNFKKEKNEDNN